MPNPLAKKVTGDRPVINIRTDPKVLTRWQRQGGNWNKDRKELPYWQQRFYEDPYSLHDWPGTTGKEGLYGGPIFKKPDASLSSQEDTGVARLRRQWDQKKYEQNKPRGSYKWPDPTGRPPSTPPTVPPTQPPPQEIPDPPVVPSPPWPGGFPDVTEDLPVPTPEPGDEEEERKRDSETYKECSDDPLEQLLYKLPPCTGTHEGFQITTKVPKNKLAKHKKSRKSRIRSYHYKKSYSRRSFYPGSIFRRLG